MKQNQRITKVIPFAVILLAFLLMPILGLNSRSWINLFITIVINIVVACCLRVITLSGNISFAHGAFMGCRRLHGGDAGCLPQLAHLADHPLGSRPGHRYGNHYWLAVCPAQDDLFLHGHHVYGAGYCAADFLLGSGRRRNGVAGNSVFE